MQTLLIVEDEPRVADFLSRGLRAEGYAVSVADTGPDGLALARRHEFAAIVLDVMLPGLSGLDVCQELRAGGRRTPILMLSALASVDEKVTGLRLGADDYLAKPFSFDELVARLGALVRRSRGDDPVRLPRQCVGTLCYDRETLEVTLRGARLELTAKELALLEIFVSSPGKVLTRASILNNVWGYTADPLTNVIDVYVHRLRSKLQLPGGPAPITTLRGVGFKLEPQAFAEANNL